MSVSARAKWREHVRAWRSSGESAVDYCARAGLNPRTLSWWAWKLKSDRQSASPAAKPSATATFVELASVELPSGFELEVGAVLVRVPSDFESGALSRLLDTLEARR